MVTNMTPAALDTSKRIEKIFVKPRNKTQKLCPIKDILHTLGDKWSILVMLKLGQNGTMRFNELKNSIEGISQKMLTVTLKNMEHTALVSRKLYPEIPPRVEYTITDLGRGFLQHLVTMVEWAGQNIDAICEVKLGEEK